MKKPLIAVTMGDPAGVGPEIVAMSLASAEVTDVADCIIVGDKKCMENAIDITGCEAGSQCSGKAGGWKIRKRRTQSDRP